MNYPI